MVKVYEPEPADNDEETDLVVELTDEEEDYLTAAANEAGVSLEEYVVGLIEAELRHSIAQATAPQDAPEEDVPGDAQAPGDAD